MIRPLIDSGRFRDNESERGRRKATLARGSCGAVLLFALVSAAYAKARPGRLNYGSSGIGMSAHLAMELFKTMAGVDILHVPYKGIAQAQTALLGGQEVQLVFASPAAVMQHVKSGRLRALGVTTAKRSSSMPDLPAIAESVPGYEASFWYGLVAPAGTPRNIIRQLNSAISEVLVASGVKEGLYALGVDAIGGDADAADRYIRQEVIKWQKVIKATGARLE